VSTPLGRLAIVAHSHAPWLLGHGVWPVGEEWLRQAWAHSYLPLVKLLRDRAERGERQLLTLGITPVLAAQWDRADSIAEQARWLADWQTRASGKALQARAEQNAAARADASRQFQLASHRLHELTTHWSAGGSAAIRPLIDAGVIEVLGGPLTHPFTPHLLEPFAHLALSAGLRDHTVRLGRRPAGIWAPECAYAPGLEDIYRDHAVSHFVVDGPTLQGTKNASKGKNSRTGNLPLHRPHRIGSTDVVAFARDLDLTYRVWSPRRGYPGNQWYQDFHTFDHEWGLHSSRVTSRSSSHKAPYDPQRAAAHVQRDARDFLDRARRIMQNSTEDDPLVVVAYDTELFGHWWHEGPQFLSAIFDEAPQADITVTTLQAELEQAMRHPGVELPAGTWGSGKDYRVWAEGEAGTLRDRGTALQYAVLDYLHRQPNSWRTARNHTADSIVTELLLALASDWAFMITKDSAADYARGREREHFARVGELLRRAHHDPALVLNDDRFPFLDARDVN